VPIVSIVRDEGAFSPVETKALVLAFEEALKQLTWVKRSDSVATDIAKQIIAIAKQGQRDPHELCIAALAALQLGPSGKARI
jgi:hypothetical protein